MRKFLLAFALLAALSFGAAQTLVYGLSGFPSSLDSADSQDGNSLAVSSQISETLIAFAPGSTELVPQLATEWSANDDATTWTFTLREGVTFHDGTPFNAEAVKYNFDRWNDPAHPESFRGEGKNYASWDYVFGGSLLEGSILNEVNVLGEYEVEMVLDAPTPFFPALVAAIYFQIDSPAAVREAGADYGTPSVGSVGTGPFTFVEWREGELVRMARYEDYWKGPAGVEEVVVRGIAEQTPRLAELQAGSIDIAVLLASDDLSVIEEDPNLETAIPASELTLGYLAMHQANEPFDDVRVRMAIAHAIDRQAIVEAFYGDLGVVANDYLPPVMFGHGVDWPYEYDPERARELLAQAGYPDGFETELWYMPVTRPYYPAPQPIAETMASYLADVGIEAAVLTEDWTTYLADYTTGKFPMYMLGWNADYADPDNFLMTFFGPSAVERYGWDSADTQNAVMQARRIADQSERASLYALANNLNAAHVASIPVAHSRTVNAHRDNVSGWVMSPLGYSSVSLHPVTKE